MIKDGDRVDALAVRGGTSVAAGRRDDVLALKGPATQMVDLQGKALMPGFIDAHSHVVQQSLKFSVVNLDPYPIGDVKTIADVQRKLRQRMAEQKPAKGQWVFGWGYDDTGLQEMRHPTRDDLDAVSKDHPILLIHVSNHLMTANSKALAIDVVAYPLYKVVDDAMMADIARSWRNVGRYRMGGIKLAIDGSIQGYTAYLSQPYYVQPKGAGEVAPDA